MSHLQDSYVASMRRDGFVVVPDVVPDADCDVIRRHLEDETIEAYDLSSRRELERALPTIVWRNQKVANMHGRGMWTARTHRDVVALYRSLWFQLLPSAELENRGIEVEEDLPTVSSFDGFVLSASTSAPGRRRRQEGTEQEWHPLSRGWLHADQSIDHTAPVEASPGEASPAEASPGEASPAGDDVDVSSVYAARSEACVQGQLILSDATEAGPGFVCLAGSHRHWDDAVSRFGDSCFSHRGRDSYFNMLDDEAFEWYTREKRCRHVKVPARKGSMILWFSTTIHAGAGPTEPDPFAVRAPAREKRDGGRRSGRAVAFVSHAPAWFSSGKDWALRSRAIAENRGTSHWTHGPGFTLNGERPLGARKGANRANRIVEPKKKIPVWFFDQGSEERRLQDAFMYGGSQ